MCTSDSSWPEPPSCSLSLRPQHFISWPLVTAQVWPTPPTTARAFDSTPLGKRRSCMEGSTWPWVFAPQQERAPELSPAQLWLAPTPRNEALSETGEGVLEGAMVPLPSCPAALAPQHDRPEEVSAHVCKSPRAMAANGPLTLGTTVAASLGSLLVPSPT